MNWDTKRKIVYALAVAVMLLAITIFLGGTLFIFRDRILPAPSCYDAKQNGYEVGVDCGGVCSLKCSQEVNPLTVLWAQAVVLGNGLYDFVGMVQNTNIDNAARELGYAFTLYDERGDVVSVINGSTTAPLDGVFPIIIQNINLKTPPFKVTLTLMDTSHYKVLESPSSPTVRVLERRYEVGEIPRVYATIRNMKRLVITNLPVRIVLFDKNDNAYAVGQTILPELAKEATQELIFTWNEPLPFPPTRIGVYPIFNPFEAVAY